MTQKARDSATVGEANSALSPRDERDVADKSAFAMAAKLASIAAATWVDIYDKAPVGGVLLLCEHVNKAYAAIRSGDVSAMSAAYEALSKDRGVSEHPQQGEG